VIGQFAPGDRQWDAYIAHLERHTMTRWALTDDHEPLPDHVYLGAAADEQIVGNLVRAYRRLSSLKRSGTPGAIIR
jgi:hypothetical protein